MLLRRLRAAATGVLSKSDQAGRQQLIQVTAGNTLHIASSPPNQQARGVVQQQPAFLSPRTSLLRLLPPRRLSRRDVPPPSPP